MSDHIPDVNKLVSDTPRTDMMEQHAPVGIRRNSAFEQASDFSRQLERELNAVSKERDEAVFVTEKVLKEFSEHSRSLCKAIDELNADNSKIELLMSANADVARIADERDAAENRIRLLIAERDTARRQADQNYKLREEFTDLLGTDDVERGVAVVREMKQRIKRLEAVTNDPHALWANWLRGSVALPAGIGDVRQYQDRIKRLEEENDSMRADLLLWENGGPLP